MSNFTYIMTAECQPKLADRWFDDFGEGEQFTADTPDAAQSWLDAKCVEAGTDADPYYREFGPIAQDVIDEALSFILREIQKANKLREGAIANDPDNEVLLDIFQCTGNKFGIEIVDDADALADLFGLVGLDAIRDAEAGIGGAS